MAKGGRRVGAGRPKGALSVKTRQIAERALAEGKTPLEIMLENMRHFQRVALDAEAVVEGLTAEQVTGGKPMTPDEQFRLLLAKAKHAAGLRQMAHDCARDAAPFVHPRLAAMEHTGKGGGPIETADVSMIEAARRIAFLLTGADKVNCK